MRRDPEQVYRVKPEVSAPLFEDSVKAGQIHTSLAEVGTIPALGCQTQHTSGETKAASPRSNYAHARRTDPRTSHEAAASVRNIHRTHKAILKVLGLYGPQTDEGIAAAFRDRKFSPSGLRSRRAELVDLGLVEACGESKTSSGRSCQVWRAK